MLKFVKFERRHYPIYKDWFQNKAIKRALGFVDKAWLAHILQDDTGIEYAVEREGNLIAVVGISLPDKEHPTFVITNIAVHPNYFGKGIGRKVLVRLLNQHPLEAHQYWVSYVEQDNTVAQKFFEQNGWERSKNQTKNDNMIRYETRKLTFSN